MNIIEQRKRARGQAGFTLIELLVVIAILAVLAGAAIVGIGAMRSNAQETACKADKDTVQTAAEAYQVDGNKADAAVTITAMINDSYLKKVSAADWSLAKVGGEWVATPQAGTKYSAETVAECS